MISEGRCDREQSDITDCMKPANVTRLFIQLDEWLRSGLENGFEKNLGFLGFLKKNLKIFKSPDFRFFRFYYFCPIFS